MRPSVAEDGFAICGVGPRGATSGAQLAGESAGACCSAAGEQLCEAASHPRSPPTALPLPFDGRICHPSSLGIVPTRSGSTTQGPDPRGRVGSRESRKGRAKQGGPDSPTLVGHAGGAAAAGPSRVSILGPSAAWGMASPRSAPLGRSPGRGGRWGLRAAGDGVGQRRDEEQCKVKER